MQVNEFSRPSPFEDGAGNRMALSRSYYENAVRQHAREIGPALQKLEDKLRRVQANPAEVLCLTTMKIILSSGLFDFEFYSRKNPTLRMAGLDLLEHYVRHGEAEGTLPNSFFSARYYRQFAMRGLPPSRNALRHYIEEGERARQQAGKFFNARAYLEANPPLAEFVDRPLFHFLKIGRPANLDVRRRGSSGAARNVRIAAHLGVKDEVTLIEPAIAHLRAIGVDLIIACDIGSTDGTAEVLERYRGDDFWILNLTNAAFDEDTPVEQTYFHLNMELLKKAPVDWVLFLDADEFWIPASGSLKDCEALSIADALCVDRFNVPLGSDGPLMPHDFNYSRHEEVLLVAGGIPDFARHMRHNPETPWITGRLDPKIMARPSGIGGMTHGMHDMIEDGPTPLRWAVPNDLFIAHLPLTTRERFGAKLANFRTNFAGEAPGLMDGDKAWEADAWHWRRWIVLDDRGQTDMEFSRNVFDEKELDRLRRTGMIRSAADIFRGRKDAIGPYEDL